MLSAILLAAGKGKRLNSAIPKPLVKIGKLPAIVHSLKALEDNPRIDEIIVVLNAANRREISGVLKKYHFGKIKAFVLGGVRRQDSVYNGLKAVSSRSGWVLIHDSARPFIDNSSIARVVSAARKYGAALLAVRPKATVKVSRNSGMVDKTLNRQCLWEAQTPQVFRKEMILKAYKRYSRSDVTDDASLAEMAGAKVKIIEGSYKNIKITTSEDLLLAALIAKGRAYAI
ncbi:MAG: 2-C-methyl-D-erythritol 4-phosphate cytidylyltransferase [Candidatus Omnitrophica bacterium]|nr:2-C-methyl-D-erythritol 4-phosphate cytidylyltransferase [Candidatus Omnitrophota bacterium]